MSKGVQFRSNDASTRFNSTESAALSLHRPHALERSAASFLDGVHAFTSPYQSLRRPKSHGRAFSCGRQASALRTLLRKEAPWALRTAPPRTARALQGRELRLARLRQHRGAQVPRRYGVRQRRVAARGLGLQITDLASGSFPVRVTRRLLQSPASTSWLL